MAEAQPKPGAAESGGIAQSLRNLAASAVDIVRTRLELLATEIEEEQLRLRQLLVWGLVALFFLGLGVVMLSVLLVLLFWDTHRILMSGLLAAAYIAIGIAAAVYLRARAQAKTKLFSASLAELSKDRQQLNSR